ncbi:MAG: tetratricopeptide repeat protein [Pyrinomonadaceae bacterium]|nr:tetratricopeptide repeat protein [Pyrinomonadaceae bacterium]
MKLSTSRIMSLVLLVVLAIASGCGAVNGIRAKSELNDGALAYRSGDYAQAQQHFERAIALDPDQKNAPLFRARSIEQQSRGGNDAKAREAITAYQDILKNDPNSEEAYNGIARMYRVLKDDKALREWVTMRANDNNAPIEKRALALTFLASEKRKCSNDITEKTENKQTVTKGNKTVIEFKKPKDPAEFETAQRCVSEGLEFANRAISVDANSEAAFAAKANLLREASRLAEMEGDQAKKADLDRQFEESNRRYEQLRDENKRKKDAAASPSPPTT